MSMEPITNIQTIVFDFGGVIAKANDASMKNFEQAWNGRYREHLLLDR